ncbi:hypothetical protein [Lacinutrix jangbogonensis]|uniref:hypothetical protein n=1 Tax=Lacinutrix jangbogonensis TaxID=1469557 RepID=UPI00053EC4EE|nr:hypothetical protein [Lacinutrix jangbogonensis]
MKFLKKTIIAILLLIAGYFAFIYYVSYSEGIRAGELVKFSNKGVIFKTWEGEISQGVSEAQIFKFSVEDGETKVIEDLNKYQGHQVKLTYFERYKTLFWLGDTQYFVTKVELNNKKQNAKL